MKRTVTFMPDGVKREVESGTLISDAASAAGVEIKLPCAGRGRCGRCGVTIGETRGERVLACQHRIEADMTVWIPTPEDRGKVVAVRDHREIALDDRTPISTGKGVAIDIGTTTIALEIVDMDKALGLYSSSTENRQVERGEDILSRLQYAEEGGTAELRELVVASVNDLLYTCVGGTKDVSHVWVSGNTVMQEIFAGNDPSYLRRPPYMPENPVPSMAPGHGLELPEGCGFSFSPSPASFVGGDVMGGIVFSGMDRSDGMCLLIDVGTNGEVALGNREAMVVCSSSAGPAFEGAYLKSGMVSRTGAIDSVRIIDGVPSYTVIGGADPEGICGSGVIDLVAQLSGGGLVDKKGSFTSKAALVDGRYEVAPGIGISEDEIKNIILTKAAVFSAARTLVRSLGIAFGDLEKVYIAGGFGFFIDLASAVSIGMFPDVPRERYEYLGNASLGASRSALLSKGFRDRLDSLIGRTAYVDLSSDPAFYDEYMSAQFLPHTDASLFPSVRY
ncbi:MAG: DUF4445 domain-containing protein [Thermoplasmatales archaeon]|nr:DUF4445 domain-containing protein [Thermoplasmatales archaeon]